MKSTFKRTRKNGYVKQWENSVEKRRKEKIEVLKQKGEDSRISPWDVNEILK